MGKNITVEEFVIVKTGSTIGRDSFIRSHSVIYSGNKIGSKFITGHGVLIRENNIIGKNVSIGSHSIIEHDVKIGSNVRIHSNVFIPEFSVLEKNCWVGPGVVLTNAKYPNNKLTKKRLNGVIIKTGAIIGAGSVILPGITIGKNAIVGAGSVVTKDVKPNMIVAGNPATVINSRDKIKDYE